MKEKQIRKYHRLLGVVLAVFIVIQAGTGFYFTISEMINGAESHTGHDHAGNHDFLAIIPEAFANGGNAGDDHHQQDQEPDDMNHGAEAGGAQHVSDQPAGKVSEDASAEPSTGIPGKLHFGGGLIGDIYRLLLAAGILAQVGTGMIIYKRYRARVSRQK